MAHVPHTTDTDRLWIYRGYTQIPAKPPVGAYNFVTVLVFVYPHTLCGILREAWVVCWARLFVWLLGANGELAPCFAGQNERAIENAAQHPCVNFDRDRIR